MTTIACTQGVMAADSYASDSDGVCSVVKIWKVPDGVIGITGVMATGYQFFKWLSDCRRGDPPDMTGTTALLITGTQIWCYDETTDPYPIDDPYAAIGSGSMAALACMQLGHGPKEAVRIAAKIDPYTGGKIRVLEV